MTTRLEYPPMPHEADRPGAGLSIPEFVGQVRLQRAASLAAQAEAPPVQPGEISQVPASDTVDVPPTTGTAPSKRGNGRVGGAFSGALKRRIDRDLTVDNMSRTTPEDVLFVDPTNLGYVLSQNNGDQVYMGTLFTPAEMGDVTFSPLTLSKRVGSRVLQGTVDRLPSARLARKSEVVIQALDRQLDKADQTASVLETDYRMSSALSRAIAVPGRAFMKREDIEAHMDRVESIGAKMFEAIIANNGFATERAESFQAALRMQLGHPDHRATMAYWERFTRLSLHWSLRKWRLFEGVKDQIAYELDSRR